MIWLFFRSWIRHAETTHQGHSLAKGAARQNFCLGLPFYEPPHHPFLCLLLLARLPNPPPSPLPLPPPPPHHHNIYIYYSIIIIVIIIIIIIVIIIIIIIMKIITIINHIHHHHHHHHHQDRPYLQHVVPWIIQHPSVALRAGLSQSHNFGVCWSGTAAKLNPTLLVAKRTKGFTLVGGYSPEP